MTLTKQQQEMLEAWETLCVDDLMSVPQEQLDYIKQFLLDQVRKAHERDLEILEGMEPEFANKTVAPWNKTKAVAFQEGFNQAQTQAQEAIKKEMKREL